MDKPDVAIQISDIVQRLILADTNFSLRTYATPHKKVTEIYSKDERVMLLLPKVFKVDFDNRQSKIFLTTFSY